MVEPVKGYRHIERREGVAYVVGTDLTVKAVWAAYMAGKETPEALKAAGVLAMYEAGNYAARFPEEIGPVTLRDDSPFKELEKLL